MYFLFGGENYYPRGGMHDLVGAYATLEEALQVAQATHVDEEDWEWQYDWWQVATLDDGELSLVKSGLN
jgi:hypothetical protein